jgi:hypothetical protein
MTVEYRLKDKELQDKLEAVFPGFGEQLQQSCEDQMSSTSGFVEVIALGEHGCEYGVCVRKDRIEKIKTGKSRVRKLDEEGINYILSYYERVLRGWRFDPWPDGMLPPAPPPLPPCPQFSPSWFEEVEE